jgi:hypothetical protein
MGTGTRILATVVTGLALVGGGVKVAADQLAQGANEAITASRNVPRPVKDVLGDIVSGTVSNEAKDVIGAACELKDSSNIDHDALVYYRYGYNVHKVTLIVNLAKKAQANPEMSAYCDREF